MDLIYADICQHMRFLYLLYCQAMKAQAQICQRLYCLHTLSMYVDED